MRVDLAANQNWQVHQAPDQTGLKHAEEWPVALAPEQPQSGPLSGAGGEEPEPFMAAVTAFLDKWAANLPEFLSELQNGLAGVATRPPYSRPKGANAAYDKFVATYEKLYKQAAAPITREERESLDVVA